MKRTILKKHLIDKRTELIVQLDLWGYSLQEIKDILTYPISRSGIYKILNKSKL